MVVYKGFDTAKDIPSLTGKVLLVTGGTAGVGSSAIMHLLHHDPKHIFFTGRSHRSAEALIASAPDASKLTFIPVDMKSLQSVKDAAESILAKTERLDVVVASAGVMALGPELTEDGYEVQFGINHLGNSALILRLLPMLVKTAREPGADVRVVMVTSLAARGHSKDGIDFDTLNTTQTNLRFGSWGRYAQSKLANILFARHLSTRYPQITSLAIHPGIVDTGLIGNLGFWNWLLVKVTTPGQIITPELGGLNAVWAATGRGVREVFKGQEGGKWAFWEPVGKGNAGTTAMFDEELMKRLWGWTEGRVGVKAP